MKKIILWSAIFVLAINILHSQDLLEKGINYLQTQEFQKAVETLSRYIQQDTLNSKAYYNRGLAFLYLNDFNNASEDFTKAIRYNPKSTDAYNNRGLCYNFMGYTVNAIEDFNRAIQMDPKFGEAYINRGSAFITMRKYDSALTDLKTAEKYVKNNPELYFQLARVYHITDKDQEAVKNFTKAISLGMTNYKMYYNRGNSYYKLKQYDKAIADYTKALKTNPKDVEVLNNRAATYNMMGKKNLAEADRQMIKTIQYKKFPPPDSIKYTTYTDNSKTVEVSLPESWHKVETGKDGDIQFLVSRDPLNANPMGLEVGATIGLIKNFASKSKAGTEQDMIGAWKQILEDNSTDLEKYQLLTQKQLQHDGHMALLRQVLSQEKAGYMEFIIMEFCVPVGSDLIYAYFQGPASEFDYWEMIFNKAIDSLHYMNSNKN